VLIVEDEALIADMLQTMLENLGFTVVGSAATIESALKMATDREIDAAVLDVNLRGEKIDPVADLLRTRGIPMIFATGYGTSGSVAPGTQVITKPYTEERLATALRACLQDGGKDGSAP
jgi:CheY-like chemotaxis protein